MTSAALIQLMPCVGLIAVACQGPSMDELVFGDRCVVESSFACSGRIREGGGRDTGHQCRRPSRRRRSLGRRHATWRCRGGTRRRWRGSVSQYRCRSLWQGTASRLCSRGCERFPWSVLAGGLGIAWGRGGLRESGIPSDPYSFPIGETVFLAGAGVASWKPAPSRRVSWAHPGCLRAPFSPQLTQTTMEWPRRSSVHPALTRPSSCSEPQSPLAARHRPFPRRRSRARPPLALQWSFWTLIRSGQARTSSSARLMRAVTDVGLNAGAVYGFLFPGIWSRVPTQTPILCYWVTRTLQDRKSSRKDGRDSVTPSLMPPTWTATVARISL